MLTFLSLVALLVLLGRRQRFGRAAGGRWWAMLAVVLAFGAAGLPGMVRESTSEVDLILPSQRAHAESLGYTVVDAAHIKDWAVSFDDSPTNGLALCKLCHWTFDSGLVGFDDDYRVIVNRSITRDGNLPGHIQQFARRPMILPERECYYPATENLAWHRHRFKLGG